MDSQSICFTLNWNTELKAYHDNIKQLSNNNLEDDFSFLLNLSDNFLISMKFIYGEDQTLININNQSPEKIVKILSKSNSVDLLHLIHITLTCKESYKETYEKIYKQVNYRKLLVAFFNENNIMSIDNCSIPIGKKDIEEFIKYLKEINTNKDVSNNLNNQINTEYLIRDQVKKDYEYIIEKIDYHFNTHKEKDVRKDSFPFIFNLGCSGIGKTRNLIESKGIISDILQENEYYSKYELIHLKIDFSNGDALSERELKLFNDNENKFWEKMIGIRMLVKYFNPKNSISILSYQDFDKLYCSDIFLFTNVVDTIRNHCNTEKTLMIILCLDEYNCLDCLKDNGHFKKPLHAIGSYNVASFSANRNYSNLNTIIVPIVTGTIPSIEISFKATFYANYYISHQPLASEETIYIFKKSTEAHLKNKSQKTFLNQLLNDYQIKFFLVVYCTIPKFLVQFIEVTIRFITANKTNLNNFNNLKTNLLQNYNDKSKLQDDDLFTNQTNSICQYCEYILSGCNSIKNDEIIKYEKALLWNGYAFLEKGINKKIFLHQKVLEQIINTSNNNDILNYLTNDKSNLGLALEKVFAYCFINRLNYLRKFKQGKIQINEIFPEQTISQNLKNFTFILDNQSEISNSKFNTKSDNINLPNSYGDYSFPEFSNNALFDSHYYAKLKKGKIQYNSHLLFQIKSGFFNYNEFLQKVDVFLELEKIKSLSKNNFIIIILISNRKHDMSNLIQEKLRNISQNIGYVLFHEKEHLKEMIPKNFIPYFFDIAEFIQDKQLS